MPRLDAGASGKTVGPRAGMRNMGASGPTSESGEAANASARTNKARVGGADTVETDGVSTSG